MKPDLPKGESLPQGDAGGAAVTALAATDVPPVNVLLVEDEALIAEIIGEALTDHGFAVHSVATAEEAFAYLSAGARVDILFTDINLPGDMDGSMLAERARTLAPALPVIYASGRWGLLDVLREQARSAILQKPYSPARACETVEALIARCAAEATSKPKAKGKSRKAAKAELTL